MSLYLNYRYCPHLLLPDVFHQADFLNHADNNGLHLSTSNLTTEDIVNAVNKGFEKGNEEVSN